MNTLPHGGLALAGLEEQLLLPGVKGLPITEPLRQGAIGVQGWNVLHADTSFPVAMLKSSALRHNLDWMRRFCAQYGAILAPHGKTTMSPQLFGAQLANGAWGITLASATQVQLAHRFGVRRVLLANQLVARADIHSVLQLMHDDPDFEFFALVDSTEGVARLARRWPAHPLARPLPLLVELGLPGKRAGCRSDAEALALAREVAPTPGLQLAGFEGYEGLLVSDDRAADVTAVDDFFGAAGGAGARGRRSNSCSGGAQILLSAGGSGYFDLVARGFAGVGALSRPVLPVLRSGCYLTSDHGSYLRQIGDLDAREARPRRRWRRRPAAGAGSVEHGAVAPRAAAGDPHHGQARRLLRHRAADSAAERTGPGPGMPARAAARLQHRQDERPARLPAAAGRLRLAVGDLVGCGISHPCTTFDKWPLLLAVDDDYSVRHAINTFF